MLNIANARITGTGLSHLRRLRRLEHLILEHTQVESLAFVSHVSTIKHLRLADTPMNDAGLAPIAGFKGLVVVDLTGTQVSDAGLVHLVALTRLTHLSLKNTRITDAGLRELAALTRCEWLDLGGAGVTAEGIASLQKILPEMHIDH